MIDFKIADAGDDYKSIAKLKDKKIKLTAEWARKNR
jgi:hypothetical protein